jgi:hypothetical protein
MNEQTRQVRRERLLPQLEAKRIEQDRYALNLKRALVSSNFGVTRDNLLAYEYASIVATAQTLQVDIGSSHKVGRALRSFGFETGPKGSSAQRYCVDLITISKLMLEVVPGMVEDYKAMKAKRGTQ